MKRQGVCICINLRRAARVMSHLYDEALADSGLKITQFSLLRNIERSEPVPISVLAEAMELDRTTLARNLAPLQRKRLVTLSAGDDQRVTEIRLTDSGRAAIARALPMWKDAQVQIVQSLSSERIEQLQDIAADLVAAAPGVKVGKRSKRRTT